jgi:hypothetical protein
MATHQARLDDFPSEPDRLPDQRFQLLCEDNRTYVLPFLCYWHYEEWWNTRKSHRIELRSSAGEQCDDQPYR